MQGLLRSVVPGLFLLVACKGDEPAAPLREPLPPPRPPSVGNTVEVGRFELSVSPKRGRMSLKPIASETSARAAYEYAAEPIDWVTCGETCLPPAGKAALWTDQSGVLYYDFDGICYSNDGEVPCPVDPPCNKPGMFCAPLQVISNVTQGGSPRLMLPDTIVQFTQIDPRDNIVRGCRDDADWTGGLCVGSGKVDAPTSSLTSPIPGDPNGADPLYGCSYCYGNRAQANAAGFPGLEHGVLSGNDDVLRGVNTALIAFQLSTANDYDVIMTIRQAVPSFTSSAQQIALENDVACARGGQTRVFVRGGGFGPPAACLAAKLTSCPLSGPPAPGSKMLFDRIGGGTVEGIDVEWSDGEVSAVLPTAARASKVKIVTAQAPNGVATSQVVARCLNAETAFVAGATPTMSGGNLKAKVDFGRGLRPNQVQGVDVDGQTITMKVGRTVVP